MASLAEAPAAEPAAEDAPAEAVEQREPPREPIEWTPNVKLKRISEVDVAAQPAAYRSSSAKERALLEHVAHFERQYIDLHPHRAPLLLCPLNECGVPKFVCTTVRPTQLPYKQLYDYDSCAAFVADYIRYEPLELPTSLPRHLPSPTAVLGWQAGDSLDMSVLLCSLLLGVGYDAYVVVGYAHKQTTLCDQTHKEVDAAGRAPPAEPSGGPGRSKYAVSRRPPLASRFLEELSREGAAEAAAAAAAAAREAELEFGADPDEEEAVDVLKGRRAHCWVLLLAGRRELPDNFYVEPSTGEVRRADEAGCYYSVEALFNAANFWVNVQPVGKRASELSLELADTSCWEHALVDTVGGGGLGGLAGAEDGAALGAVDGMLDLSQPPTAAAAAAIAAAAGVGAAAAEAGAPNADAAVPAAAASTAGGGSVASRTPREPLTARGADGGEAQPDSEPPESRDDGALDLPPSWVGRLALTAAQVEARCPGGSKAVPFRRGVLQKWAPYARPDGLVSRVTLFADDARKLPAEVRDAFSHRQDRLCARETVARAAGGAAATAGEEAVIAAPALVRELFLPGRPRGLREQELVPGEHRRLRFFPSARLDGLESREEELRSGRTTERFVGRDDRLVLRVATYAERPGAGAPAAAAEPSPPSAAPGGAGPGAGGKEAESAIVRVTERYSRDEGLDADSDVAKCTYDLVEGGISVRYHFGPGRIVASSRAYEKDAWPPEVTHADAFAKRPADAALREDFAKLLTAERECLQALREQEREVAELLKARAEDEASTVLTSSVYDTGRAREYLDRGRYRDETPVVVHDYLTPFLPKQRAGAEPRPLNREAALKAREACLKSLRERLVERATIIQSRLDEENASLAKKTSTFSRNRDHADKQTEEEYEAYCQGAIFRIQIIEERLKRHERQALQKYEEMDARLRADPRMGALLQ